MGIKRVTMKDYCKCEEVKMISDGVDMIQEGNPLDGTFKITYKTYSRCACCGKDIEPDYKKFNLE